MYRKERTLWIEVAVLLLMPLALIVAAHLLISAFLPVAEAPPQASSSEPGEDRMPDSGSPALVNIDALITDMPEDDSAGVTPLPTEEPSSRENPPAVAVLAPQVTVPIVVPERVEKGDQERLLRLHNDAREKLGIAPLSWSLELQGSAQLWADVLAGEECSLRHSYRGLGENLYYSRKYGANQTPRTPEEVMNEFLRESRYYDRGTNTCAPGQICGHYTQIVWADTTLVGCAKSACISDEREEVWVCHYTPAGNVEGQAPY